jgi:hypothetical protein
MYMEDEVATGNHQTVESVKSHLNSLEKSPSHTAGSSPIAHGSGESHSGAHSGAVKKNKSFKEKGGMKRGQNNKGYIHI